jgi:hypothetical protein
MCALKRRGNIVLAGIALIAVGCGGNSGPPRTHVSGKITFKGESVPAGKVYFNPDASKGNTGVQGFATIKQGAYDTRATGEGAAGGPTVVLLEGFDGVAKENLPLGMPLFKWDVRLELPKEGPAAQDFEVPAEAADRVSKTIDPP